MGKGKFAKHKILLSIFVGFDMTKVVQFCGIPVVCLSRLQFVDLFLSDIRQRKNNPEYPSKAVFSLNGESLAGYYKEPVIRKSLELADWIHADGMSIVKGSRWVCSENLPERISTTDWFHDVANSTIDGQPIRHFFLGSKPDVLQKVIETVKTDYPELEIVGYQHGYFKDSEWPEIQKVIQASQPHIIWIGLGRPKQEQTALQLRESNIGVWVKTCGGLFDHIAKVHPRAPILWQKLGFEWLFRLLQEPRRLFKRYLYTNVVSISVMLKYAIRPK